MRGMNKTSIVIVAAATAGLLAAWQPGAHAETLLVDGHVMVAKTDIARPTGGMTMAAVEARFGTPRERHPTIGKPPITRWDYDRFSVFFEKDRVIDAVVPASAQNPATAPAVATDASTTADHGDVAAGSDSSGSATPDAAGAGASGAPASSGAVPDTSGRSGASGNSDSSGGSGDSSLISIASGAAAADATVPVPANMPNPPSHTGAPAPAQPPAPNAGADHTAPPTGKTVPTD